MNAIKEKLRKELLDARQNLSIKDREDKSVLIASHLKKIFLEENISSVHIFESVEFLAEVDTRKIIDYLKQTKPEIKLYHLRKIKGVWQNVDDSNMPAGDIEFDAIIVPTLGFDDSLNRLGYGGGYYDRLLSTREEAEIIGLCFEVGHVSSVPKEAHDVCLTRVITEKQVYTGIIDKR